MFARASRLARDPRRRAHLARARPARRDAGNLHRGADVRHATRAPRGALARADRRAASRAPARDAARGARHDGLPDAPQPPRAGPPWGDDALRRLLLDGHDGALLAAALLPLAALLAVLLAPVLLPRSAISRSARLHSLALALRHSLLRVREGLRVFRDPATPRWPRPCSSPPGRCSGLLLAAPEGARTRPPRGDRRRRGRAVRGQRHRCRARHSRQRRRLPGRLRRGARGRLPRLDPQRRRLRHHPAGRRDRHRGDHGHARPRQGGPLLEGSPPAHDARHPGAPPPLPGSGEVTSRA